ncbi:DsbC family protein [Motiliproteus sp. MSK22-1]|uniref:DsbC family protein n=1 Tax=Motiliproteus sp. MSK22-1 TaxID=1897630 RepID=UPI0009761DEB|nr:DsbC family protein [Motiliproteus sp. MSK22-1]OMH35317.1 hypothetical protein BGP75_10585 [Motiliproteus sp. MSK22-1]
MRISGLFFVYCVATSAALFQSSLLSAAEAYDQIRSKIQAVASSSQIIGIKPTAVPGLMEVEFDNGKAVYASSDGEYILDGTLFKLTDQGVVDIRGQRIEAELQPVRKEMISSLDTEDMVVFSPAGEVKATVYAFTDVDCGYCRKLHSEMQAYNDLGIEVRYLAFPRAGTNSHSYDKMVAIWCAEDRQSAMTDSKAGRSIAMKSCENPVSDQYALGNRVGVRGTPALMTVDGELMPGYVPAPRLAQALGLN